MKRILGIDLRCLPPDGSEGAGIAHATRAIAQALLESVPPDCSVRLYLPKGAILFPAHRLPLTTHQTILSGNRRSELMNALRHSPCDLLFVPSGAAALNLPVPAIPWVHDVDIYTHPEWFGESWFTRLRTTWMFRRGLEKAPMMFAVSEYTKKGIKGLGIQGEVTVTGEGGDENLLNVTESERIQARERLLDFGVDHPFVLMLGTVEPRKNIPFALSVFPDIDSSFPDLQLVIAGKDGWKIDPINLAISNASPRIRVNRLKNVSEELRRDLLISASLILVPSFSEGFGLVALEGIQAGVPVIASDRGALPEIVGDTALACVDKAWTLAIKWILTDPVFKEDWLRRQSGAVFRFTWKQAAEKIWSGIYSYTQNQSKGR